MMTQEAPPSRPVARFAAIDWNVANEVLRQIAREGKSMAAACKACGVKDSDVFLRWTKQDADLARDYVRAKEERADFIFEDLMTISDTPQMGEKTIKKVVRGEEVTEVASGDMIEHRRLQVDTRKWVLARMNPGKYGEKVLLEHSGAVASLTDGDVKDMLLSSNPKLQAMMESAPAVVEVPESKKRCSTRSLLC